MCTTSDPLDCLDHTICYWLRSSQHYAIGSPGMSRLYDVVVGSILTSLRHHILSNIPTLGYGSGLDSHIITPSDPIEVPI